MTTRKYTSRSQQTTLTGSVTSGASIIPVVSATTLLGGATVSTGQTFTVVIDPDTALEEVVDVTAISSNNLTITRAIDGSSAQDHSAGAVVRHMIIGRDLREANTHIEASNGVHGLASTSSVVGTQDTQTLYNKTLIAPVLTATTENDAGISFQGTTVDAYTTTLSVIDPTANRTITLPNTSGTVDLTDSVTTLTNKTLTSPTINGTPVITGLSSTGMSTTSATPKNYVDSILGSATAASTSAASAATSASSAATSASSAATSAASALTSAASALTSQTAAATSASSAATSASSALTSQTAAATSASSAATSASSALTSQTAAATSASSAATSASSALTSQTAAATSASSAATSQTAAATSAASAATSATSAAASATAAATSAASAAASTSAAATSATSAAASATAAATSATSAAASATAAATSAASSSTSASAALTYANSAATSASSALTSQTAAATSAASAATSATSSATSASSSLATYNTYKTYYLGSFSSAPSLDNQGNALITGATYFNTGTNLMYAWSGSTWLAISTTSSYSAPTLGSTTINSGTTYSNITGITLTTSTVAADPTTALGIASKQYVDAVTAAINFHAPVQRATTANLTGTYNNGTSGVGATFTITATGRLAIDGGNVSTNDRVLLKNQTTDTQNGIYVVTNQGGAGVSAVLTRAGDYDQPAEITNGDVVFCTAGTVNTGVTFVNTMTASPTVIGTSSITWSTYTSASLPSQTGNSGLYLTTDGTTASWATATDTSKVALTTYAATGSILVASAASTPANLSIATTSGWLLTSNGTTAAWAAPAATYTAPTLGSTALTSGSTITTVAGLTLTSPVLNTPTVTLSTTSSTTDARMSWDSTNKKIQVGNGTAATDFASSTLVTNGQTASYTTVLTDKDKLVELAVATANNLTVPPNSSVAYPIGTQITVLQTGAGQTTVVAGSGVTINATPGLKLRAQWSSATLIKRATDTWVLVGDLSA